MDHNILDEVEKPLSYTDEEIFTKIWVTPRPVFQFIHENQYEKFKIPLLLLAGIGSSFNRAASNNSGDDMSLPVLILVCVFFGGLLGWISYYLYSALISWTGKWLDGDAGTDSVFRVFAYSMIPSVAALVLLIPQLLIYGNALFRSDGDIVGGSLIENIIFYGSLLIEFGLGIWTIVLTVIGVSVVQRFGIGKAILNLILPILVIVGPLIFLFVLFDVF
jgi:hypothetical protein